MNRAFQSLSIRSHVVLTGASVAMIGLAVALAPHHAIAASPADTGCPKVNLAQGAPQHVINNAAGGGAPQSVINNAAGGGTPQSVINNAAGGGGVPQNVLNNASGKAPNSGEMRVAGNAGAQKPAGNCN